MFFSLKFPGFRVSGKTELKKMEKKMKKEKERGTHLQRERERERARVSLKASTTV